MAVFTSWLALTWGQTLAVVFVIWLGYATVLAVQRLWLSPIAHIPGPKLAALTQYYEFYYDIVLGGQYTFKIMELHQTYGSVVRINPWEVHTKEHDFHTHLFGGPTRPRQKWKFWTKQAIWRPSALSTIDHDHHRLRRSVLNPFFSTQSVRNLQPVLEERVDALLQAFHKLAATQSGTPINIMYPFSAFTNVERSDFGREVTNSLLMGTHMGPFIKHASWALALINSMPESVSGRWIPGWSGFLKMKNSILEQIEKITATENTGQWKLDVSHPTILHDLLSSKLLPDREKLPARLAQEGQILVQGGTLTSSWALSLATFHLVNQAPILRKLRDELFDAIPDADEVTPLAKLESLPYLRAVVRETLRYSIGTSGRLSRIAVNEEFLIHDHERRREWRIPAGTVVSMSPYMTVMDESIFPDPSGFHPERWLNDGDRLDKYLTVFGGGTRSCLGKALALAEMYLVLAKLFRRWGGDGDVRPGDTGVLRIFETTPRDCQMASDYFIPIPYKVGKSKWAPRQTGIERCWTGRTDRAASLSQCLISNSVTLHESFSALFTPYEALHLNDIGCVTPCGSDDPEEGLEGDCGITVVGSGIILRLRELGSISFTFILPLFPKLLEFYRDREAPSLMAGGSPTLLQQVLGGLNKYKASFARPIDSRYDIVLLGGAMGSLFSYVGFNITLSPWHRSVMAALITTRRLLQAIASPLIGRLSDRYGRRTALLTSMCGNMLSVLLWVAAIDFRTFVASRIVGGLSEGNVQLATAMASDISDESSRGSTMAVIGACFSIAFTFGPGLGAWLSTKSLVAANPFATAASFSLALIVTETTYLYFFLPETLPALAVNVVKSDKGEEEKPKAKPYERANSHFVLNAVHFFFLLFFSGMESSLSFMTYDLFQFTSGLVASIFQGGVTRRLPPLLSVRIGVIACLAAFFLLGRVSGIGGLYAAATCLAVTSATVVTGLNALSSFEASEDERGGKLGILRSWGQMGRGLGPVLFTSVYWWAGREYAYNLGATGIALVSAAVLLSLKTPRGSMQPASVERPTARITCDDTARVDDGSEVHGRGGELAMMTMDSGDDRLNFACRQERPWI
ncbi:Cytochrome P450 [Metarhizium album ARSEF 1941]|uniref:Cytochrome P450 n=1 Tax=Metarhizium album (strain ARSEF 1941) TaxID=1081103 RepID=A0A0B2WZ71_METAS|nr:Cytochrome P450 [Metarhizium album ARSEF 1941]KHN98727.1 Cytochrome P450 [Metarhizium album ARSEF 1941]